MSNLSLLTEASRDRRAPRRDAKTLSAEQLDRLTVIDQIRRAFGKGARLAGSIGFVLGGFVPAATWTIVHYEVQARPAMWALVGGGLLYSATTVFSWANAAFGSRAKAAGFCVLLEGILTFGRGEVISLSALGILIFVNAVSAACALQVRKT